MLLSLAIPVVGQKVIGFVDNAKLAPSLRESRTQKQELAVRVQVKDKTLFLSWMKTALPALRPLPTPLANTYFLAKLSAQNLAALTECPYVTFVDAPERIPKEEAHLQNADLTVNKVEAVQVRFPEITGKGLVASIKENAFDPADIDFRGRVLSTAASSVTVTPHATGMATLVGGGGNTSPLGRGVAWQSNLVSSDFSQLLPDETSVLRAQKVSVQNHSYGVGVENYYGLESQAYDQQVIEFPELLHVFSSGNAGIQASSAGRYAGIAGFANLTGQFKISKNTLTVGAVDTSGNVSARSSKGPTFDGRIKPEVVAFGESGSSEASAVVSGVGLLLQQAYQEQHSGKLPPAALVKAALVNSADEKGRLGVDYEAGFGNVDALGAVQSLQERRYFAGSVSQGNSQKFVITAPAGAANLKVTLVWNDPAASPTEEIALVNDLDLTILEFASGREWLPWGLSSYPHKDSLLLPARRQVDRINNVEQVTVALPSAGEFEIKVFGYKLSSADQSFSLVYEFEAPFTWAYPTAGSLLRSGQVNTIRWDAPLALNQKGRLEYRWAGQKWQLAKENVSLQLRKADWLAPDSAGLVQVRLVTGAEEVWMSDEFLLSPVLSMQVGYQCGQEFMLFWPDAKGMQEYQVYGLGDKYLELIARVTDTLLVLNKAQHQGFHYAVTPVLAGKTGLKSFTINYAEQGVQCYLKQFLARQQVTDTVLLDVELSTLHGLAKVVLERKSKDAFQVVQSLDSFSKPNFSLTDLSRVPGRNEYRLQLVTSKGEVFYSETESVFYSPEEYVQVFPNPVLAGSEVQVVASGDELTRIQVLDHTGRALREIWQDGAVKTIKTVGLKPGVYILKVLHDSGNRICRVVLF
ncbi:S8 family serine peptidase [Rufibacter tibetensis]|uniref:Peptidase S8/S53 domain-containing protein n=1 Tax=Rufibacter tibetensis TaxID=512763 RepID=A0A0P0CW90_9BACT|nr:S8 family serine peptidase [Rufibacter tibetensis]ALI99606.1 hypothetical protein DC20_12270 [Rufibacter tibetensis]